MKRNLTTIAACTICAAGALAATPALKIYDINVNVNEATRKLDVDIDMKMDEIKLGSNREVIYTPIIIAANGPDSLELDPVTVCGRNSWYAYLRSGALDSGDSNIFRSGTKVTAHITQSVPFEDWMGHSTVEMRQQEATCCSPLKLIQGPSAHGNVELAQINTARPALVLDFVYSPPVDDKPVEKNIEGKAFVSFVVNRTELRPDYMVNRREIAKILNSIDYVRQDSDAVITGVHIKGFASPEGSYTNNTRLAKGRTATLAGYVREQYHFPDGMITTSYDPEDWAGLRNYLTDSLDYNIANRAEIIDIIDGPLGFDAKDMAIKTRFPQDYQVILKEIYPWLRHSDYTVKYRIKVYTDLAEILRAYNSDPSRLRPVDFYTIAQQHDEGSPEYNKVMQTAVKVYPDDPMLNLNAANTALKNGYLTSAQEYLNKAGNSPEANFARGILAAMLGSLNEATQRFQEARACGITKADAYLRQIQELRDFNPVTITVETTRSEDQEAEQ